MAVKTTTELKAYLAANITTNGTNAITGAILNTMLVDMIDSLLNKISDATDLATKIYRAGEQAITTSPTQITFSSDIGTTSYRVIIADINGIGWENITDKQITGFKITGLTNGTINYFVFLNN